MEILSKKTMQRKTMNTSSTAKRSVLIAACLMAVNGLWAQEKATVYLSLKQGNVTISGGNLTAVKRSGSSWTQVTETINYNNTYEIGMWASNEEPSVTPTAVTTVNGGTVNIVNVSDSLLSAVTSWDSRAGSVRSAYKSSNYIDIAVPSGNTLNIVLNNCWTDYDYPGFKFSPGAATSSTKLRVGLKGDNRFTNFHIYSSLGSSGDGYVGNAQTQDLSVTEFYDAGSDNNKGTLVVDAKQYSGGTGHANNSALGGYDDWRSNNLTFTSGTFFVGSPVSNDGVAIGGGGNNVGTITINGGTITAVNTSLGATIGGGMGAGGRGGDGYVTINGGTVYAYNHASIVSIANGCGVAIGGGSTKNSDGGYAEVTVNGGTVYAQSTVGPAIGGGSTDCKNTNYIDNYNSNNVWTSTTYTDPKAPGDLRMRITGGSVTARTLKKVVLTYTTKNKNGEESDPKYDKDGYPCTISGGWNVSVRTVRKYNTTGNNADQTTTYVGSAVPPGNLYFEMTGGELNTGSLAGGRNVKQSAIHGLGYYTISGGKMRAQFLQWNASGNDGNASSYHSYFRMTGGLITTKMPGYLYAENDGVVWCERTNGEITISGGTISGATAFTDTSGDPAATPGVGGNDFGGSGGAISIMRGTLNLNGGTITGNTATGRGGGVYASLKENGYDDRVATINIGETGSNKLVVRGNTAGGVASDIYLNTGQKINVVGNGFNPQDVGIYTESGTDDPIAVLTTDTPARLTTLWNAINYETKNLFPDRPEYKVKPYSGSGDLYFYKNNDSPWSAEQKTVKDSDLRLVNGVYEISNVKELTAFLWYVNNIDTHHNFDANAHPEANGKLTADIDMGGHYWVPIGTNYTGTFDGNGHTIKNLKMARTNPSTGRGLFGTVSTGTIKNVQLVGCDFYDYQSGIGTTYMGCIVAQMTGTGATLMNSVANGTLKTTNPSGVMGGLAGNNGGSIHSSFASATLNGYTMGGLVGNNSSNSSNLKNSFANAKFASSGEGYVGGLVGVNSGTVENCYVREQSDSSHGSNFGWCVGDNSGTITYCYIPVDQTAYKAHGTDQANTCTTYGTTQTPYLYKHADNQMTANANNSNILNGAFDGNGLKGLLPTLNNWVGNSSTYAKWMRTSASPINNDYPVFEYGNAVCVGSPDNINLEYSNDFNDKFGKYITANSGTIYLYKSPSADVTSTLSNSSGNPALYIHEDVALKHTSAINAYVGITLDNSAGTNGANPTFGGGSTDAVDWHFFSSATGTSSQAP